MSSVVRDSVKQIARGNDTFISGHAILDSEILMNGYYYYTVKVKSTGGTIPMVKMDIPNVKLESPINMTEVSVQKMNDIWSIIRQGDVASSTIYKDASGYYGRSGNGVITDDQLKEKEAELIIQESIASAAIDAARLELGQRITLVDDPASGLIKQAKDTLTDLMGQKDTALKNVIEDTNSVLNTNIANAKIDVSNSIFYNYIDNIQKSLVILNGNATIVGSVANSVNLVLSQNGGVLSRLNSLELTVNNTGSGSVTSRVSNLEAVVTTPTTGLAAKYSTLEAAVTSGAGISNYAILNQISLVSADAQGKANAIYGIDLSVNGRVSGFKNINNGTTSTFSIVADRFYLYNPTYGDTPVFGIGTVNGVTKLALRGDMVVDGSITANKLAIGTGKNLLANSSFEGGFFGYTWANGGTTLTSGSGYVQANIQQSTYLWANNTSPCIEIIMAKGTTDAQVHFDTPRARVKPNTYYWFQVALASHRTAVRVEIYWKDANGNNINGVYVGQRGDSTDNLDNAGAAGFDIIDGKFLSPSTAVFVTIKVVNSGTSNTTASTANSYIWACEFMIEETIAAATNRSPYVRGGSTLIDGGLIQTNTINANSIIASTLFVSAANVTGQISASQLAIVGSGGKILGTYIDGTGIFTQGNVVAQNGFYVLKQLDSNGNPTDKSTAVSDPDNDQRLAFGVNSQGQLVANNAKIRGDITGVNAKLTGSVQAQSFNITKSANTLLTQTEINTTDYKIIKAFAANFSNTSTTSIQTNGNGSDSNTYTFAYVDSSQKDFTGSVQVMGTVSIPFSTVATGSVGFTSLKVQVSVANTGQTIDAGYGAFTFGVNVSGNLTIAFSAILNFTGGDTTFRVAVVHVNTRNINLFLGGDPSTFSFSRVLIR